MTWRAKTKHWAKTHWRAIVALAALVSLAAIFLFGFFRLDELAKLAGLSGFSMNDVSAWTPLTGGSYPALWAEANGTAASSYIAVHLVLDAFLILSYGAGFFFITGWMKARCPRFATVLRWLLLVALAMDVLEDTLFGIAAANLGSSTVLDTLTTILSFVTPKKWLAFAPLALGTLGGLVCILIRWFMGRQRTMG